MRTWKDSSGRTGYLSEKKLGWGVGELGIENRERGSVIDTLAIAIDLLQARIYILTRFLLCGRYDPQITFYSVISSVITFPIRENSLREFRSGLDVASSSRQRVVNVATGVIAWYVVRWLTVSIETSCPDAKIDMTHGEMLCSERGRNVHDESDS